MVPKLDMGIGNLGRLESLAKEQKLSRRSWLPRCPSMNLLKETMVSGDVAIPYIHFPIANKRELLVAC